MTGKLRNVEIITAASTLRGLAYSSIWVYSSIYLHVSLHLSLVYVGANPDIDFSFNVFRLLENDPSVVSRIYEEYRTGQLLSGEMKAMTADRISNLLEELSVNREKVKDSIGDYMFSPDRFR